MWLYYRLRYLTIFYRITFTFRRIDYFNYPYCVFFRISLILLVNLWMK